MKKLFNFRAIPIFMLVLIISICVASFLHFAYGVTLLLFAALLFGACFIIPRYRKRALLCLMLLIAVAAGTASSWISLAVRGTSAESLGTGAVELEGRIANISSFDGDGKLTDTDSIFLYEAFYTENGKVRKLSSGYVEVKGLREEECSLFAVGDKLKLKAYMAKIPINVSDQNAVIAYREFIDYRANVIEIMTHEKGSKTFFDAIKIGIKSIFSKYCGESSGLMYAMIFGDKQDLNTDIRRDFSAVGLAHLLAISGLHVAMLSLLIMFITRKLRVKEWVRIVILAVILILFNVLCCFTPSVMRASVMIIICYVAGAVGLRNDSISTLSFAGCCILICRPFFLFDLSFIMSFMAVTSLIFFGKALRRRLEFMPSTIAEVTSASIAVNFGMLPILLTFFGMVSYIFVIANLIILPVISAVYPLMLGVTFISFIPYVGYLLTPISWVFEGISWLIGAFAKIPFMGISAAAPWALIIPYILLMVVVSKFFLADKVFKNALTAALVIVIGATSLITSNIILRRTQIETVGGVESSVYLITSKSNKTYAVFNGEADAFALDALSYELNKRNKRGVEALIISDISEDEIKTVRNYYTKLAINSIYTAVEYLYLDAWLSINYYNYCPNGDFKLYFNSERETVIEFGGVSVMFSDDEELCPPLFDYDIIYASNAAYQAINYAPSYVVNNDGYKDLADYCVPNNFTFVIINGRIKAGPKL